MATNAYMLSRLFWNISTKQRCHRARRTKRRLRVTRVVVVLSALPDVAEWTGVPCHPGSRGGEYEVDDYMYSFDSWYSCYHLLKVPERPQPGQWVLFLLNNTTVVFYLAWGGSTRSPSISRLTLCFQSLKGKMGWHIQATNLSGVCIIRPELY